METNKKMTKLRNGLLLMLCLFGVLAIGGIAAYFTDVESAANVFTTGKVAIDLAEPEYDAHPEEHQNITPNKVLRKDPNVTNTGVNDAFVFLEFTVPKASVKTANEDGSQNPAASQELFSYEINDDWIQVAREDRTDGCRYVYAYGTPQDCKPLAAGDATPVLFKEGRIRFANVIEGQDLENETLELPVDAYGIQSADLNGGKTAPKEVWSILENQQVGN